MGGGAMFPQFRSTGIGLADPKIIPIHQTNDNNFVTNRLFSTVSNVPFKPSRPSDLDSSCIRKEIIAQGSAHNLLGPVPTQNEVLKALSDLQELMNGLVETESYTNQHFPVLNGRESGIVHSPGFQRVFDALHMLETEPSVKKMVLSISIDSVVWDAISKTDAVQNLQCSISAAKEENVQDMIEGPEITNLLMRWIMGITKVKILELIEGFRRFLCEAFQPNEKDKPTSELNDLLEEKLRSSFLLSVVLLTIVIVTRNHGA